MMNTSYSDYMLRLREALLASMDRPQNQPCELTKMILRDNQNQPCELIKMDPARLPKPTLRTDQNWFCEITKTNPVN